MLGSIGLGLEGFRFGLFDFIFFGVWCVIGLGCGSRVVSKCKL